MFEPYFLEASRSLTKQLQYLHQIKFADLQRRVGAQVALQLFWKYPQVADDFWCVFTIVTTKLLVGRLLTPTKP